VLLLLGTSVSGQLFEERISQNERELKPEEIQPHPVAPIVDGRVHRDLFPGNRPRHLDEPGKPFKSNEEMRQTQQTNDETHWTNEKAKIEQAAKDKLAQKKEAQRLANLPVEKKPMQELNGLSIEQVYKVARENVYTSAGYDGIPKSLSALKAIYLERGKMKVDHYFHDHAYNTHKTESDWNRDYQREGNSLMANDIKYAQYLRDQAAAAKKPQNEFEVDEAEVDEVEQEPQQQQHVSPIQKFKARKHHKKCHKKKAHKVNVSVHVQ